MHRKKIIWIISFLVSCIIISSVISFSFCYNKPLDIESLILSVAQLRVGFASTTEESNASAFLIDDSGNMLTNFHALSINGEGESFELANDVSIKFPDEVDYTNVEIVKYDKTLDIALIHYELMSSRGHLNFSNKEISYGQNCYAIGNSNNQGIGIMNGIISIPEINIVVNQETQTYIQANIDIYPGSSGGCLLNSDGKIIGMTSFRLKDTSNEIIYGYGYSIPYSRLKTFLNS
ncbi:MAG: serine protease [Bacilli bacterium]